MEELNSVWGEVSTRLYQQTENVAEEETTAETADVEYEEVN